MKRLVYLVLLMLGILGLPLSSLAQGSGSWVDCIDRETGYKLKCFVPASTPSSSTVEQVSQTQVYQTQNVTVIVQPVIVQSDLHPSRSHHDARYSRRHAERSVEEVYEPYEENQEQEVTETIYGGGVDPWSGRPNGHYEVRNRKYRARVSGHGRRGSTLIQTPYFYWSGGFSYYR